MRPSVAVLEDLYVEGMKRNLKLALSISDVGSGEFRRQMTYKTAWQGEALLLADRWFPSTKRCSGCGNVKGEMDLSERISVCENPACGLVYGRRIKSMRISITDKCNFRCTYCMPAESLPWLKKAEILSYEEIERIARVAVGIEIEQIRLTGGEPLLLPTFLVRNVNVPSKERLAVLQG